MIGFIELVPLAVGGVDLVALMVAVMCLLFLFAGWVVFAVLNATLGKISILGAHPFGFIFGGLEAGMKKLAGLLDGYVYAMGEWLWSQLQTVWRFVYVTVETLGALSGKIFNVNYYAQARTDAEKRRAQQAERNLQFQEQQDFNALNTQLSQDMAQVRAFETATLGTLSTGLQALQDQINQLANRTGGVSAAQLQALQNQLEQELAQNTTNLQNGILHAEDLAQANLNNAVGGLQGQIANGVATAEGFATNLAPGIEATAVARAVAQLAPQLQAITTEVTECLDPLCNTVTPQAPRAGRNLNWLQNLEDLGLEALLIALAAECLTDPAAVVRDVSGVVHAVGDGAMAAYRDLIGA